MILNTKIELPRESWVVIEILGWIKNGLGVKCLSMLGREIIYFRDREESNLLLTYVLLEI